MKQSPPPAITDILNYARLAPSVHNTQPWTFRVTNMTIDILVNHGRSLADGDPTKRELWISLGACLETLLLAAQALGHTATAAHIQTDSLDQPIARITITPQTGAIDQTNLDTIAKRHSYRGPLLPATLPISLLATLQGALNDLDGVSVQLLDKPADIESVADLTYKGMRLALSSPGFRHELADLIHYNWSPARTGMHGFALNRSAVGSMWEKWSIRLGLDIKQKALADRKKVTTASSLVFITAKGDVPQYWLVAGRAYVRVCHIITETGLAHSTIAAPVEAASFHEDIERLLNTPERIQAMIRIGKAAVVQKKFSPRLAVDELLT